MNSTTTNIPTTIPTNEIVTTEELQLSSQIPLLQHPHLQQQQQQSQQLEVLESILLRPREITHIKWLIHYLALLEYLRERNTADVPLDLQSYQYELTLLSSTHMTTNSNANTTSTTTNNNIINKNNKNSNLNHIQHMLVQYNGQLGVWLLQQRMNRPLLPDQELLMLTLANQGKLNWPIITSPFRMLTSNNSENNNNCDNNIDGTNNATSNNDTNTNTMTISLTSLYPYGQVYSWPEHHYALSVFKSRSGHCNVPVPPNDLVIIPTTNSTTNDISNNTSAGINNNNPANGYFVCDLPHVLSINTATTNATTTSTSTAADNTTETITNTATSNTNAARVKARRKYHGNLAVWLRFQLTQPQYKMTPYQTKLMNQLIPPDIGSKNESITIIPTTTNSSSSAGNSTNNDTHDDSTNAATSSNNSKVLDMSFLKQNSPYDNFSAYFDPQLDLFWDLHYSALLVYIKLNGHANVPFETFFECHLAITTTSNNSNNNTFNNTELITESSNNNTSHNAASSVTDTTNTANINSTRYNASNSNTTPKDPLESTNTNDHIMSIDAHTTNNELSYMQQQQPPDTNSHIEYRQIYYANNLGKWLTKQRRDRMEQKLPADRESYLQRLVDQCKLYYCLCIDTVIISK